MAQRKATAEPEKRKAAMAEGRGSANDAAPPKDRRRERGEASVQRIIDATIELIAEEGLASVTMQRIAEHVGSSNALVVFHFRSKENLFRAVLQYLSDQYDELWVDAGAGARPVAGRTAAGRGRMRAAFCPAASEMGVGLCRVLQRPQEHADLQ